MKTLSVRQLVDAAIKSKRGLTLVTSKSITADEIYKQLCVAYDSRAKSMGCLRGLRIDGVVIRIQVGHSIPTVYNVWHV